MERERERWQVRFGGGGSGPPLAHEVDFLTLGPKLAPDPPLLRVDLSWTLFSTILHPPLDGESEGEREEQSREDTRRESVCE